MSNAWVGLLLLSLSHSVLADERTASPPTPVPKAVPVYVPKSVQKPVASAPTGTPRSPLRQPSVSYGFQNGLRLPSPESFKTSGSERYPLGVPGHESLEACVGDKCIPSFCSFNMGKESGCFNDHRTCSRKAVTIQDQFRCDSVLVECRRNARNDYKFNCHDFAYESCRQLNRRKFPAWILGVCDKNDYSGHAMVIVKDVTAPEEKRPYYCIHEPQYETLNSKLCWTSKTVEPIVPKEIIAQLKKDTKHYAAVCDGFLKLHDCDDQGTFYKLRNEMPWWMCTPDGSGFHADPRVIPHWSGPEH